MGRRYFDASEPVGDNDSSCVWLDHLGRREISTALRIIESRMRRFPGEFDSLAKVLRARLSQLEKDGKGSADGRAA
jgi:hypothetical protein